MEQVKQPLPESPNPNSLDLTPDERKEKADILCKLQEILAQYGNREGDIPITNNYWILLNTYRMKPRQ